MSGGGGGSATGDGGSVGADAASAASTLAGSGGGGGGGGGGGTVVHGAVTASLGATLASLHAAEDGVATAGTAAKRARGDGDGGGSSGVLAIRSSGGLSDALIMPPALPPGLSGGRLTDLEAPSMLLTGHDAAVLDCAFSPPLAGVAALLATASRDRHIQLWRIATTVTNVATLAGHKNAVTGVSWQPSGEVLGSSCADGSAAVWDVEAATRLRVLRGAAAGSGAAAGGRVMNAIAAVRTSMSLSGSGSTAGADFFAGACDDGCVRVWDVRSKVPAAVLQHKLPATSVSGTPDGSTIFSAAVDGCIVQWELRRSAALLTLPAHADTVTGLATSPDGRRLASFGLDNVVKVWDVRPFVASASGDRCVKALLGAVNNFESALIRVAWSAEGEALAVGSADRVAYVFDVESGAIRHRLPGHTGVVTSVAWHPSQPILATASSDKRVFVGEVPTH